jgi:hypothetical protein
MIDAVITQHSTGKSLVRQRGTQWRATFIPHSGAPITMTTHATREDALAWVVAQVAAVPQPDYTATLRIEDDATC